MSDNGTLAESGARAKPGASSRAPLWVSAVVAFVVVVIALSFLPRGAATGTEIVGDEETVELSDGVTASILPEIRELGWRASSDDRLYELNLHLTVENSSGELFPRWYRVVVFEADDDVRRGVVEAGQGNDLGTVHFAPGEKASSDLTFYPERPCGEFVARISYQQELEEVVERSRVNVPFVVGDEHCLAER